MDGIPIMSLRPIIIKKTTPFGNICLDLFPSIKQADPSILSLQKPTEQWKRHGCLGFRDYTAQFYGDYYKPLLWRYYGPSGDFVKMGLFVSQHSGWSALAFGGNGGMKGAQQQLGFCQGGSEGERITAVGGSEIRRSPVEVVYPNKNKVSYIPTVVIGGFLPSARGKLLARNGFFFRLKLVMRQSFVREDYAWASDKRSFSHTYILSLQRSQRVYTPSKWMGLEYDWFPFGARSIFRGHVSFGECNPNQIKPLDYESLPFKTQPSLP